MKEFFQNVKTYKGYLRYAPIANLKTEVSSTYLNWLWWFLDPLFFMLVYTFVAKAVFKSSVEYFPMFVFIGLNAWNMFSWSVTRAVNMIRNYRTVISKTYVPKYILVLVKMNVEAIKVGFSYIILIVMMIIYKVAPTWHIIETIPLFILLYILTFGISCVVLHIGVYVSDFNNIIPVGLRLAFYMTGIFFDLSQTGIISNPVIRFILCGVNPMYPIITGMRNTILYGKEPDWPTVICWFFMAIAISCFGIWLINKHEDSYVKMV